MGKAILITGGARSGKSTFAETTAKVLGDKVLYIATGIAFDEEMKDRIRRHRDARPQDWDTYEGYKDLGKVISDKGMNYDVVLLDCVTVMITNQILEHVGFENPEPTQCQLSEAEGLIKQELERFLWHIRESSATVLMVTNELGSGVVPENKFARAFRDIAGRANQIIAGYADEVHLVVCGIPLRIK